MAPRFGCNIPPFGAFDKAESPQLGSSWNLFQIVCFRNGPLGVKPLVSASRILGAPRESASWHRSERGARNCFSSVVAAGFLLPSVVSAKPPHHAIRGNSEPI
jgi:hypothetical protein